MSSRSGSNTHGPPSRHGRTTTREPSSCPAPFQTGTPPAGDAQRMKQGPVGKGRATIGNSPFGVKPSIIAAALVLLACTFQGNATLERQRESF